MKKALFLALLLGAACSGRPQERPALAKAGFPAPDISLPKLLNAPVKSLSGWEDLRGKAVVLEFWATWCDPCVDAIPGFNRLAERFAGRPVVFIHVTDESEADVRAFLKGHPMSGWVAPEAGADVFKAFRVFGRPHTVLVGPDGVVAAFPRPGELTADMIMELLAGRYVPAASAAPAVSTAQALGEFYIAPAASASGTAQYGPASLEATGMPLEYALEWVFGKVDRFDVKPGASADMAATYDIRLRLPESRAAFRKEFFLKGLESALGLKAARLEREAEVYVLRKAPGGPSNVRPRRDYGGADMKGAVLEVRGASFAPLVSRLREALGRPVLDETGAAGPYEYDFELASADPGTLDRQLQRRLGLRLDLLKRRIAVVEVSR
ncbi:MAG: redoxin domain-containing protein [Elusimicrobia bacterium]|nr:redoxin domain-containing protein [Elusimicrobiota bacterium]